MSGPCEAIVEAIYRDEIEPLKERNTKLVAALEAMLDDPCSTLDEPDTDFEVIMKMRKIAREALQQSTEKP